MKNILFCTVVVVVFSFINMAQAGEYQCNISSTRAAGCEPFFDMKQTCPFPEELNQQRTTEIQNGKPTYPEFCTTCGTESQIPKRCQSGRISTYTPVSKDAVISDSPEVTEESAVAEQIDTQKNTILQNAYGGFKLAVSRFWNWFKVVSAGDTFEIKNPVTPVAGVRG